MALPAIAARAAPGVARFLGGKGGSQTLNALSTLKNSLPVIEEEMEVTVYGDHEAKKSELYFLALSLIWGQVTRRNLTKLLPPAGSIMLEHSLEENAVRAVVRLRTSYLDALVASATNPAARKYQVFDGPSDGPYQGGPFQWRSQLPFFPGQMTTGWEGKTILTREPTYEDRAGVVRKTEAPAPPGDGVSRGVESIATSPAGGVFPYNPAYLVYAALSLPCSTAGMTHNRQDPTRQPPAGTVTDGGGRVF